MVEKWLHCACRSCKRLAVTAVELGSVHMGMRDACANSFFASLWRLSSCCLACAQSVHLLVLSSACMCASRVLQLVLQHCIFCSTAINAASQLLKQSNFCSTAFFAALFGSLFAPVFDVTCGEYEISRVWRAVPEFAHIRIAVQTLSDVRFSCLQQLVGMTFARISVILQLRLFCFHACLLLWHMS